MRTQLIEQGQKYTQLIEIHGANGVTKSIRFNWIENPDGIVVSVRCLVSERAIADDGLAVRETVNEEAKGYSIN